MQIEEIPHNEYNYGTIIALISFVAFSSDAWFYQMASSWMKAGNYIDADGGYTQQGLQYILLVGISISIFGVLCGLGAFIINRKEIHELKKKTYRWRNADEGQSDKKKKSNKTLLKTKG